MREKTILEQDDLDASRNRSEDLFNNDHLTYSETLHVEHSRAQIMSNRYSLPMLGH